MFKNKFISVFHFVRERLGEIGLRYTKFVLFERPMEAGIPAIKTEVPVKVRKASKYWINRLSINKKELSKRSKDICFVSTLRNQIAGYIWATLKKSAYIPPIEKIENFKDNEAYIYDARVLQCSRGKNIGKKMLEKILHHLKSKNIRKVYAFSYLDNTFSQKALKRMGFYSVKMIIYIRIFMFKRYQETRLR